MANRNWQPQQVYKGRRRQKENMVPVDVKSQNLFYVISDEEALKIHGLNFENNSYSTDSDSGKSDFDEEYFKYKPQPFQINPMNMVTIKSLNPKNKQLQVKEGYEHNAEMKKDFSSQTSGKHESSSSLKKNVNEHQNNIEKQLQFKIFQAVNPYIHENLNKFAVHENNLQSLRDIICQSSLNKLTHKRPSENVQDVAQTSTKTGDDKILSKTYYNSTISNKGMFHPVNFQKEVLPDNRNIRDIEIPNMSRQENRTVNIPNIHIIPETRNNNLKPTNESTHNTVPNYTLNVADIPSVITNIPNSSSTRNSNNSLPSRNVSNIFPLQNVQASSSSHNLNVSTHRHLLAREPKERRTSENASKNAGKNIMHKSTQSTIPNFNQPLISKLSDVPNVITAALNSSVRRNSKNSLPSQNVQTSSNHSLNVSTHRDLLTTETRSIVKGRRTAEQTSESAGKNTANSTPMQKSIQSTVPNYNQSLTLNVSDLPNVITTVPSLNSRRTSKNSLPSRIVQASSSRNLNLSADRDLLTTEPTSTLEERRISEDASEDTELCGDRNNNFCGRCISFIFCRKC